MAMYSKDKTEIFKVRLTPAQSDFILTLARTVGCSKSDAIRLVIDSFRFGGQNHENK